jgi:hypothetical protein
MKTFLQSAARFWFGLRDVGFFKKSIYELSAKEQFLEAGLVEKTRSAKEVGGLDGFCMKRLRTLKSFEVKLKKSKTYSIGVDVLFKAYQYPMVTL